MLTQPWHCISMHTVNLEDVWKRPGYLELIVLCFKVAVGNPHNALIVVHETDNL